MKSAGLRGLLAAAIVGAAAGAIWYAARKPPVAPSKLVLVVSGDTAGWITPCGCTSNQSGGLPRRATYLGESFAQFYADVGGAPGGDSKYQKIKFEAILRGEQSAGLAVHNIGAAEAKLGSSALQELIAATGVRFVSSNVAGPDGNLLADPYVLVERKGWRLAFLGVLSPKLAPKSVQVKEPREAVSQLASALKSQCDAIVVLAYLPSDELRQLALEVPEVDVVVGGPTGQAMPPQMIGPVMTASATNKGKFLAQFERERGEGATWTGRIVEMSADIPDDPFERQNVEALQDRLLKLDLTPEDAGLANLGVGGFPSEYRIAGSESCRTCHAADCTSWDSSKHAEAWKTLVAKKFSGDPSCRQCHTTGYGLPGGFRTAATTADRTKVGCESCHGPSQAHREDPKMKTPMAAKDRCVSCHDLENSPHFDYEKYWSKILHGKSAPKKAGPER